MEELCLPLHFRTRKEPSTFFSPREKKAEKKVFPPAAWKERRSFPSLRTRSSSSSHHRVLFFDNSLCLSRTAIKEKDCRHFKRKERSLRGRHARKIWLVLRVLLFFSSL